MLQYRQLLIFVPLLFAVGCQPPPRKLTQPGQQRPMQRGPYPAQQARRDPPPQPHPIQPRPFASRPGESWFPRSGRISKRWTTVVVHHSATDSGGARAFDRFHRGKGWDELGYHFVIGNGSDTADGMIEVGSRWHSQKHGAHCKTPDQYYNEHGIGICLVGDFTRSRPTARQMQSLVKLVKFLSYECGIPAQRVTTHGAVTHGTLCPGKFFAVGPIRRALLAPATATSMP